MLENRRCPNIFVSVCDNPSKCVLNTLQFAHVDTGKTPQERVAVIKATTHQDISRQDDSPSSQVLCNPPQFMNLNEAYDMFCTQRHRRFHIFTNKGHYAYYICKYYVFCI